MTVIVSICEDTIIKLRDNKRVNRRLQLFYLDIGILDL